MSLRIRLLGGELVEILKVGGQTTALYELVQAEKSPGSGIKWTQRSHPLPSLQFPCTVVLNFVKLIAAVRCVTRQ